LSSKNNEQDCLADSNRFMTQKDSLNNDLKIFTALDEIKSELTETKMMLKIIKEHQIKQLKI